MTFFGLFRSEPFQKIMIHIIAFIKGQVQVVDSKFDLIENIRPFTKNFYTDV